MNEYYVIYDNNDNILFYVDDLSELSRIFGKTKHYFKFRLKYKDYIDVYVDHNLLKIYKFF